MEAEPLLSEFVAYCKAHPEFRFWQALYGWSEARWIFMMHRSDKNLKDVFHLKTRTDVKL